MPALTQDLIDRGLQLPPDERQKFANLLLDSLDADEETVRREWREEIQLRWDRYERGEDPSHTLEETMAALRRQAESRNP